MLMTFFATPRAGKLTSSKSRLIFYGTFLTSLHGMKVFQDPPRSLFRTYNPSIAAYVESGVKPGPIVVCEARLSHPGHSDNVKQLQYLQSILPEEKWRDVKITLIAPECTVPESGCR